jgi:hypothetical protein
VALNIMHRLIMLLSSLVEVGEVGTVMSPEEDEEMVVAAKELRMVRKISLRTTAALVILHRCPLRTVSRL